MIEPMMRSIFYVTPPLCLSPPNTAPPSDRLPVASRPREGLFEGRISTLHVPPTQPRTDARRATHTDKHTPTTHDTRRDAHGHTRRPRTKTAQTRAHSPSDTRPDRARNHHVPFGAVPMATSRAGSLEREQRLNRLKDNLIALQQRYGDLLRCAQLGTDVEQQMGELQTPVLASGMVRKRPARAARAAHF